MINNFKYDTTVSWSSFPFDFDANSYSQWIILEVDALIMNSMNSKTSFVLPLPQSINRSFIRFNYIKNTLTWTLDSKDTSVFLDEVRRKIPNEIAIDPIYLLDEKERKSERPFANLALKVSPSSAWLSERYNFYYSKEFESRLINKRSQELRLMLDEVLKSDGTINMGESGLYVLDNNECTHAVCSFTAMGLKPLNLSQLFTLSKVLVDMANNNGSIEYRYFVHSEVSIGIYDHISNLRLSIRREFVRPALDNSKLNEW